MKTHKLALLALALCLLVSCQDKPGHKFEKIKKMEWLVGNWEQKLPEGVISENWIKENDSTYTGKSFFIKEEDTIHLERIVLTQKKDELLYIPTVNGQNNDEPVTFKMTSDADNSFSFENPTHDYPTKITYKKINDTSIVATISGKQQGKETKESYSMTKK
ncbi:MAG: DUF6265 family protein [Flavobacterium sp.]